MNQKSAEWMKEQKRVDQVIEKVKNKRRELHEDREESQNEIVHIRRHFWEDVTVNLEDATEAAETAASMRQQAEILSERERKVQHADQQVTLLRKMEDSPYFGRIDFQEEGEELEKIYLGVGSFYDEENQEFLVYDWRAPISSLYYDFPPGPAVYQTPSGPISGSLERKRQFVIKKGKIESLFDTGVTIGDELLQEILGKHGDAHMRSIVATIQREQNQMIRNHRSKVIIVQGVAGSGKTSAALQRVAYLLYRDREHLRTDQMILFSPNQMFNSYVATVLPELGEENIKQTTFQEYLEQKLGNTFRVEDPFDQMEFALGEISSGYQVRREGICFKSSQAYFDLLEKYIDQLGEQGMIFQEIRFRGKTYLSSQEIEQYFYGLKDISKIPNRLEQTKAWIMEKVKEWEQAEQKEPWVEEQIDLLDEETYDRVYRQLQKKQKSTRDSKHDFLQLQDALAKFVVRKYLAPLKRKIKQLAFVDFPAIYLQLFSQKQQITQLFSEITQPNSWEDICRQTIEKIKAGDLFYEDATPYVYLKERLEGFHANLTIRHLFIDEAQDYSPFQFAVLSRLFPRSKITILGDFYQAIFPHTEEMKDPFLAIHALFDEKEIQRYSLNKSYRSTMEIMMFARQLIKGGEEVIPFQRHGQKPALCIYPSKEKRLQAIAEQIKQLQVKGNQSIAVLCKTELEAQQVYENLTLQYQIKAQRLHKHSASFHRGVVVLPAYLAKGIEFDVVLIADASKYQQEWERKLFYTACTRAMHKLYLYAQEDTHPFLQEVTATSYQLHT